MRIAVNTRLLLRDKLEGIGWFAHETLSRIVRAHPEHRFIFLFDRAYDRRFLYADNVEAVVKMKRNRSGPKGLFSALSLQWITRSVLSCP